MQIALRDVAKRFGATAAVEGVTLDIADGELFTLLGPSGCGKTTLLRLIAGFYRPPDAGEIHFGERRGDALPPYARHNCVVFPQHGLLPRMDLAAHGTYVLWFRPPPAAR